MDWKSVAIGVLVVAAVLLGGVVMSGLRPEPTAYGQGGVYSTYLAVTASVQSDFVNFVILDTESRRMRFYQVDPAKFTLQAAGGRRLADDFKHTAP